jgi:protein SPA2
MLSVVPFLPVRDDFHPKRNQARQKLATLPKTRFKDLASDVFYEIDHRYPHFQDEEVCNCYLLN